MLDHPAIRQTELTGYPFVIRHEHHESYCKCGDLAVRKGKCEICEEMEAERA